MRATPRLQLAVLATSVLATLLVVRSSLRAQPGNGGGPVQPKAAGAGLANAGAADPLVTMITIGDFGSGVPDRVMADHLALPFTPRSVEAWLKLQAPGSLNLAQETPLEDVLKAIKEASRGKGEKGVAIYVDPIGLQEAEKTMKSTVTLDVEDVPLARALAMVMGQLGLEFVIEPDGLIVISSASSEDRAEVLPLVSRLKEERAMLRGAFSALQGARSPSPTMGGMGGGFR